jgi:hypothetical protein
MWLIAVLGEGAVPVPLARARSAPRRRGRISSTGPPSRCTQPSLRHDQRLPERVRVPGRARPGLEGDEVAGHTRGRLGREERIEADAAGEPLGRAGGRGKGASVLDLHIVFPRISTVCTAHPNPLIRLEPPEQAFAL